MKKDGKLSKFLDSCLTSVRHNLLALFIVVSVLAGIGLGLGLKRISPVWTTRQVLYVSFPWELYLRMIKCLSLPLVISAVIAALGGLDLRVSGKIGLRALVYYLSTTPLAILLGTVLVVTIRPGHFGNSLGTVDSTASPPPSTTEDAILDLLRNLFPENLVESCFLQYQTVLTKPTEVNSSKWNVSSMTGSNLSEWNNRTSVNGMSDLERETSIYDWKISGHKVQNMNILGLVVFSIAMGISIGSMGDKGKQLAAFFDAIFEAIMNIISWVICVTPIAILFLVAGKVLEMHDASVLLGQVGSYTATVILGLMVHGFLVIPMVYFVVTRKSPYRFLFRQLKALTTVFATASSSATLPVTIRCLEENNKVHPQVSRFVMPIGILNLQGTALYEAVAAIFIAQVHNVPMGVGKVVVVSLTAALASMGGGGIPALVLVLNTIGLPPSDVSLVILVDWLLDRFRSMVNVVSDSVAAGIVDHLSANDLQEEAETELTKECSQSPLIDITPPLSIHIQN